MSLVPTISHSEVEALLLCPRKHFYGYALELEPVAQSEALTRGKIGHSMLEAYFKVLRGSGSRHPDPGTLAEANKAAKKVLLSSLDVSNGDIISTLSECLRNFHRIKPLDGYLILAVEEENSLHMDGYDYPFIPDLLVEASDGRVLVVDTKFVYNFYSDTEISLAPQIPKYIGALIAQGKKVDGGAYLMLRTRKMKEGARDAQLVSMVEFTPTKQRLKTTMMDQIKTSEEILEIKSKPLAEQSRDARRVSNTMVCGKCNFATLCGVELSGGNTDLLLRSKYRKRVRRTFEREEEVEADAS